MWYIVLAIVVLVLVFAIMAYYSKPPGRKEKPREILLYEQSGGLYDAPARELHNNIMRKQKKSMMDHFILGDIYAYNMRNDTEAVELHNDTALRNTALRNTALRETALVEYNTGIEMLMWANDDEIDELLELMPTIFIHIEEFIEDDLPIDALPKSKSKRRNYYDPVNANDPQSSHDPSVGKILEKNNDRLVDTDKPNELIYDEIKKFIKRADISNKAKNNAGKTLQKLFAADTYMARYKDTELGILRKTWASADTELMKEAVIHALADSVVGDSDSVVCPTGRTTRLLNAFAGVKDGFETAITSTQIKDAAFAATHKAIKDLLNEYENSENEELKAFAKHNLKGESIADGIYNKLRPEYEKKIYEKIDNIIKDYEGKIDTDRLREECRAGV